MKKILLLWFFIFFGFSYTNANFVDIEEIEEFIDRFDMYNEEDDETTIEIEFTEDINTPFYIKENDKYINIEDTWDLNNIDIRENETIMYILSFEWDYTNEPLYVEKEQDSTKEKVVDNMTKPLAIWFSMIWWLMASEFGILIAFVLAMWLISMAIWFYVRYTWFRR